MTNIQIKYNLLDAASQKEVSDFVDFLLNKKKKKWRISLPTKRKY
jgi:hypothetical protein